MNVLLYRLYDLQTNCYRKPYDAGRMCELIQIITDYIKQESVRHGENQPCEHLPSTDGY